MRLGAATTPDHYIPTEPVVVRGGDTLWSIAESVVAPGQNVQEMVVRLQLINGLKDSSLRIGDVLEVPRL
jgi:hypothetical protein